MEVTNFLYATSQLAQTTLRSVLGEVELDELLSQREKLNVRLQSILDQHTSPWGVKVTMVEVKQVDLAEQMIRAIARQAEAERERRAKIIHAEGEYTAAEKLSMAAAVIQKEPVAIQLRYLQTLVEIGAEKNTTIVFPLPVDIISGLGRTVQNLADSRRAEGGKSVKHEKQRNRRIRTGSGRPAVAERVFHCRAAVRGGLRDGVRGGAERTQAAGKVTAESAASEYGIGQPGAMPVRSRLPPAPRSGSQPAAAEGGGTTRRWRSRSPPRSRRRGRNR